MLVRPVYEPLVDFGEDHDDSVLLNVGDGLVRRKRLV